jgi:hypothetical protein
MVPPPHEQPNLIQKVHSELGHFKVKRTYIAFLFLIIIREVCMFKSEMSLLSVNNVIE